MTRTRTRITGSSPLARGLPAFTLGWLSTLRIIPARAGFTGRNGSHTNERRDHPRSRGVYLSRRMILVVRQGSSPLARGLPPFSGSMRTSGGIIPARAGFTLQTTMQDGTTQDHPRSRGVYFSWLMYAPVHPGSSPLARGLLRLSKGLCGIRRIIPARAGFTLNPIAIT